ncbi:hypothetical protein F2Q70_00005670 [Brassica cretica]|uniref:Pentatricopeptide repeat-containing protein n=1 Tax=Brassica cretica TaxID=69181 RepID=A0A8S9IXW2_BRACR|nr:hypothetical protein F2Q70_00005670 [Brassica cretica]
MAGVGLFRCNLFISRKCSGEIVLSRDLVSRRLEPTHVEGILIGTLDEPKLGLRFFNFLGLHRGFDHSTASFCILIHALVKSNRGFSPALHVLREVMMKEVGLVPQVRTLSALLHGLVHCRHYGLVMGVFEEMINVGVRPDLYIYSGVWNDFKILDRVSIGHGGRADKLVFEAVVQIPDSPLFNQGVVLQKLNTTHAQRRGRRAIEVLKKLVRRRLLYHSYSMQVHGYISNSLRDDPYSFTLVHGCHGSFSIRHWLQQSDWLPTLEAAPALDEESWKVFKETET